LLIAIGRRGAASRRNCRARDLAFADFFGDKPCSMLRTGGAMRRLVAIIVILAALTGTVLAQAFPYYADPSAREASLDTSAVPSIRFLTTPDFPPFNYRDKSGQLVGYNIDLAGKICSLLKIACTIQSWPWDQATKALADNQGDALIAGLAVTPQNARQLDFSDIYFGFPARFVTRAADAKGFDPDQLAGKTVAVRKGSAHADFARRYLPKAVAMPFDTEDDALAAVKAGKAFAYFGDGMRAAFWLNDNAGCCAFAGKPYFRPDLFGQGLAVAVPAGRDSVREAINSALVRLKRDGTLDALYLRWFPVGFY
jgi:polar amino acid transport system substrate-binding protein